MNDEQTRNPEFYDILANSLLRVLDEQIAVADVVNEFPEYADELRAELEAALFVQQIGAADVPQMGTAEVAALERRLRSEMQALSGGITDTGYNPTVAANTPARNVIPFPRLLLSRTAAAVIAVIVIFIGGSGGLITVSADAMPGDALYPVKRGWEGVQLAFGSLVGQGDAIREDQVETRLKEAQALSEQGVLTEDALNDLESALNDLVSKTSEAEYTALLPLMERVRQALATMELMGEHGAVRDSILLLAGPTYAPTPTVTPTATMTPTPTATATETPVPTETPVNAVAPVVESPTPSRTPRFEPTPSRTPTATTTSTAIPTVTIEPSATLTAIPLVIPVVTAAPATAVPSGGGIATQRGPVGPPTASPTWYPWTRATQDAIRATQTYEAGQPEE